MAATKACVVAREGREGVSSHARFRHVAARTRRAGLFTVVRVQSVGSQLTLAVLAPRVVPLHAVACRRMPPHAAACHRMLLYTIPRRFTLRLPRVIAGVPVKQSLTGRHGERPPHVALYSG